LPYFLSQRLEAQVECVFLSAVVASPTTVIYIEIVDIDISPMILYTMIILC